MILAYRRKVYAITLSSLDSGATYKQPLAYRLRISNISQLSLGSSEMISQGDVRVAMTCGPRFVDNYMLCGLPLRRRSSCLLDCR